jgi:hypothetical protein
MLWSVLGPHRYMLRLWTLPWKNGRWLWMALPAAWMCGGSRVVGWVP